MLTRQKADKIRIFACEPARLFAEESGMDLGPDPSALSWGCISQSTREGRLEDRPPATGKMVRSHHGAATVSGE